MRSLSQKEQKNGKCLPSKVTKNNFNKHLTFLKQEIIVSKLIGDSLEASEKQQKNKNRNNNH